MEGSTALEKGMANWGFINEVSEFSKIFDNETPPPPPMF